MIEDYINIIMGVFFVFITGVIIGLCIKPLNLESPEIIIPHKKLVIVDNKVDTIYQYKLEK